MEHTLKNGQVVRVDDTKFRGVLSAYFQIWAMDECGLTDEESLAVLFADMDEEKRLYFDSVEQADIIAAKGFNKLGNTIVPNLTNYKRQKPVIY